MKRPTVSEVARSFSSVLDDLERDQEEIVLVRNDRQVARIIPATPAQEALAVLGDLFCILDNDTAEALVRAIEDGKKAKSGRIDELRDPWAI